MRRIPISSRSWPNQRVFGPGILILVWITGLWATVDCNHRAPYVRDGADVPLSQTVAANDISEEHLVFRLVLIGDAGQVGPELQILQALTERASVSPEKTGVVFLGDNVYPDGLIAESAPGRARSEQRLAAQVDAARESGAEFFFVPGNHDWSRGGTEGLDNILRAEAYVLGRGGKKAHHLPTAGGPGPACLDRPAVRLVFVDSQWFIHRHNKAGPTPEEAFQAIGECIRSSKSDVVVLSHHPIATEGVHGGRFTFEQHLFPLTAWVDWMYLPLPVVGSLYPWVRGMGVSIQDLPHSENQRFAERLRDLMAEGPTLIHAAGHDHNLQVFESHRGPRFSLVSGSGSATTPVRHSQRSLYSHSARGFMEVAFYDTGRATISALAAQNGQFRKTFERVLRGN